MKRLLNWFALDHRSLGHQPLFWMAMGLPVLLFFYFGWFSWKGSSLQWDQDGFNNFINSSRLPLGLLALTIPFTVLITSMHRSIQTAKQIEEAQVKNTADRHFAHMKFFIDELEKIEIIRSPIALYSVIFPNAKENDFSWESEPIQDLIELNEQIISSVREMYYSIEANTNEEEAKARIKKAFDLVKNATIADEEGGEWVIFNPLKLIPSEGVENDLKRIIEFQAHVEKILMTSQLL